MAFLINGIGSQLSIMVGTVMRLRGVKRYRHPVSGIWYCYHRKTGKRIIAEFGTASFIEELAAIEAAAQRKSEAKSKSKPGTLGLLLGFYRQSASFNALKPRVRKGYEDAIRYLAVIDDMPVSEITPGFIAQLRDKTTDTRTWHFANDVRKVLSVAFSVACEAGVANTNPVKDTKRAKRPKDAPRRNRSWQLDERLVVMRLAPPHLRLPIALGMYMGLREGDVLRLPKTARRGMWFVLTTEKTNEYAELPIPRPLVAILKECGEHDAITLCANSYGRPWTQDGFSASFRKFLKRLENEKLVRPGLTFHGLRHTVATVLKEAGHSDDDIAAWLTHSPEMARHYSRDASKRLRRRDIGRTINPLKRRSL
jgi:integrase